MKNNTPHAGKVFKFTLSAVSFLTLFHSSSLAQGLPPVDTADYTSNNVYIGFGGAFGIRSQKISSNYSAINSMCLVQEGGNGIAIFGNRVIRTKIEVGFYYSSPTFHHTIDLIELSSSLNVYPLQVFSKTQRTFEPYIIMGVSKNYNSFYGFYHIKDSNTPINYSVTMEPYIGKSVTTLATVGTGLEFHIKQDRNFIHVFAEAKYSKAVGTKNSPFLMETSMTNQFLFNLGFLVGKNN